jgi:glucose-6-phosphate isomerase
VIALNPDETIGFDGDRIVLAPELEAGRSGQRTVTAMLELLADPPDSRDDDDILYLTWTDVRDSGSPATQTSKVGYSLTVIRPQPVGWEVAKTHGHVHAVGPDGIPPAEAYQVLHGEGLFLLQDMTDGPRCSTFTAVRAGVGDVVVIPGGLFHCSLNVGTEPLVFGDLCRRGVRDVYDGVKAAHGFAYYWSTAGVGVRNETYVSTPEPATISARDWAKPQVSDLWTSYASADPAIGWLWDAAAFADEFPHLREYATHATGTPL